mgnify:CR=1 FL=1
MKPLFLIRPEPGWSVSAETARAMGLDVHGAPLFTIEPVAWDAPDPADFDGLLVGSANTFRHGGKQLAKLTKLPVHAVGEATADAARAAGFLIGRTGRGGLQNLLDELSKRELRLLRLAGADRVTLRLPDGIRVETRTVYRAVPEGLAEEDRELLRGGGVMCVCCGWSPPGQSRARASMHAATACRRFCVASVTHGSAVHESIVRGDGLAVRPIIDPRSGCHASTRSAVMRDVSWRPRANMYGRGIVRLLKQRGCFCVA